MAFTQRLNRGDDLLQAIQDNEVKLRSLGYDTAGRLTSETQSGKVVAYQYDANSNLIRVTWPDGAYAVYA